MKRFNPGIAIVLCTFVLSICGAVFGFSQKAGQPPDWVLVGENETGTLYYDSNSIRHDGKGMVSVRTRHIFSPEIKAVMKKALPETITATHYTSFDRIDCRKWEYMQVDIKFRDANLKIVNTTGKYKKSDPSFRPIPPGTFVERLASEVCLPSDIASAQADIASGQITAAPKKGPPGASGFSEKRLEELAEMERQGDLQGIIAYCQVWTMAEPKNASSWSTLGWAYAASGDTGRGIVYLKKGLELDPGNAGTWYNLGLAYAQSNQRQRSAECYEKCISIDPDYAAAWYNLGILYKMAGEEKKVMNAYHELKRINPAKAEMFHKKIVTAK